MSGPWRVCDAVWRNRIPGEDVISGQWFHGRIPRTAKRPRFVRVEVTSWPVLTGTIGRQYCPELRIPLDCSAGLPGHRPGNARTVAFGETGPAAGPAMIAWCAFMISFLFTIVNTQFWGMRIIYSDFVSVFAAFPPSFYFYTGRYLMKSPAAPDLRILPETKV